MTAKPTQVEINGRVYDAKTGEILSISHSKKTVVKRQKSIDGFISPAAARPIRNTSALPKKPRHAAPPAKGLHEVGQKTKRLHPAMSGVHRPSGIKRHKPSTHKLRRRKASAASVQQSKLVNRHRPKLEKEPAHRPIMSETKVAAPLPFMSKKLPKKKTETDKKQADESPTTEDAVEISWFKKHLIPAAASFSALVLLGGFMIYNSLPSLTMRVAASRAGFDASVPNYQPSGYTFGGPVSYGPGRVVIKFNSNTDEREFTITEKRSGWDSRSLLDNYVETEAEDYLTFEEHGLTVYLYNDSQATWVDDGIWYTVEGSADLSSEQLLKIAASL